MDYDVRQAKRAECWMLHGDWRFKGANPTVELADFTPTAEQYNETSAKLSAKAAVLRMPEAEQTKPKPEPIDPEQLAAMRNAVNRVFQRFGAEPIGGNDA